MASFVDEPRVEPERPEGDDSLLPQFQILLVDDSAPDAQLFELALRQATTRIRAYWVATGEEAIDFLLQQGRFQGVGPVKLVVLDLHMPGQDGFQTLRKIREDPKLKLIPVILFSSSVARSDVNQAYSLGVNAYFAKPMTLDSYLDKITVIARHWLDLAELPEIGVATGPSAT